MTTNEQIIIDGVDVSGCSGFSNNPEDVKTGQTCWYYTEYVHDNEWGTRCPEHPNCEYKQLARKTQECEELKDKRAKTSKKFIHATALYNRYRKALEKIEAVCNAYTRTFADGTQVRYDSLDEILDIISKAKDGKDE